ncbi:MAG: thiamine pyrophosphate-binding protein [Candidatus Omnitrophota bacterium]
MKKKISKTTPSQDVHSRNGARVLVECLEKEGVEVIFGYPGAAVLPLFDLLFDSRVRFVLTRHEQGASHAADGYARVTGKPGVCLATSGPGAVNLVTGLATAYMDSVPLVAVTGQVKTTLIGNDAFQEADVTGITRPITKHNYLLKDAREIPGAVREAFHLASSGRPGPVLIDLPVDVQQQVVEGDLFAPSPRQEKVNLSAHRGQIHRAVELIAASQRPLIIAGGGAVTSGAQRLLVELADRIRCPAAVTLMGMGVFPAGHGFYLGMPGMHGTVYANRAISESDLIIAVGVRFDDRVTGRTDAFAPRARIIQIDIDPSSIGKNIDADLPITADASAALAQLLKALKKLPDTGKWLQRVARLKKEYPLSYKDEPGKIKPQSVIEEIYKSLKAER